MYTLSTLYALRARLGLAAGDTADDTRLLHALLAAAAHLERAAGRAFAPRRAARRHNFTRSTELLLDDDLLELTALTNGDGAAIPLSDVLYLPEHSPYVVLRLTGNSLFVWDDSPLNALTVSGVWGWHDRWPDAWRGTSDSVQANPLSASAVTLTVTDADGIDSAGEAPRFQVGHLLKIEEEYLWVLAVNTTTNVITVQRGANGSTAATHAQNMPIYTYQPPADVAALSLRLAAWLYREPDGLSAPPADLLDALDSLRRPVVKV